VDIVIDDGGPLARQQSVTLEDTAPLYDLGGVYICEDIAGVTNPFLDYVNGFTRNLNATLGPITARCHQTLCNRPLLVCMCIHICSS
jgi:hypothetical protein